jgi:hypothetical protein
LVLLAKQGLSYSWEASAFQFALLNNRLILVSSLTLNSPSALWTLGEKQFEPDSPTQLSGEFARISRKPAIFFVRWPETNESSMDDDGSHSPILDKEFGEISAIVTLRNIINHIVSYLEAERIPGNAFRARALASWHALFFAMVDQAEKAGKEYGIHPADLAVGLIKHLTQYLKLFELDNPNTSGDTLIPMAMIYQWQEQLPSGGQFLQFLEELYVKSPMSLFHPMST